MACDISLPRTIHTAWGHRRSPVEWVKGAVPWVSKVDGIAGVTA